MIDEAKREYWINRITEELNSNGQPIWYDSDLVKSLDYFKIIETDLNSMSLITFKDGGKQTMSQQWKYFLEAEFIFNGEWADPNLRYNGKTYNYYEIEDAVYADFKDYAAEENIEINDENFAKFCAENQDFIKEVFENAVPRE